jgi:predicted outer membrane repeat protein
MSLSLLLLKQGTFANNTATGAGGGAIYANSTTDPITATNVLFQNNTATAATGVGGTAYLAGSKGYVFDNSGFLASTSGSYGGALYVSYI